MYQFILNLIKYKVLYETGYKDLIPMAKALRIEAEGLNRVWQKFCQVLACRDDLIGTILANELRTLLDDCPPHNHQDTIDIINEGLPNTIFETPFTDEYLIGSGTIAQVYRAYHGGLKRWVAVKVKHPKINEEIDDAYKQYQTIANSFFFPQNLIRCGQEFFNRIYEQADFKHEYDAGCKIRDLFNTTTSTPHIFVVPKMLKWSSNILLMEYEPADLNFITITDHKLRNQVGLIMIYIQVISIYHGIIHSDLHWGNFAIRTDPLQIVLYDFGWVVDISKTEPETRHKCAKAFFDRDVIAIFNLLITATDNRDYHLKSMIDILETMEPNAHLASKMKRLFLYTQCQGIPYNDDLLAILYACIQCEPLEKLIAPLPPITKIHEYLPYAEFDILTTM
jgi:predicted unusual protein kinase regulating ubiquinone biosynthesis (AarF/ABC1/UbiB family)